MKTLTEFSAIYLRKAAAARATRAGESLEGDALVAALAGDLSIPEDRAKRLIEALDIVGQDLERVRNVRVFQGEKGPIGATSVGEFHYSIDRVATPGRGDKRRGGDRDRGDRGGERRGGGPGGGGGGGGFGGGGRDRDKPRGLGSLKALMTGEKKTEDRDDRPQRGEIPRAGIGWQLTAAPRDPRDDRGRGKGRGRPGDRRGPRGPRPEGEGGDRRGPGRGRGPGGPGGGGPGGPRGERRFGGGPGGGGPGGGGPGGSGPRGPGGPGGAPGAEAGAGGGPGGPRGPGGPGGPDREGRRGRRGGRGRGRGPGGPGGGPRQEHHGGGENANAAQATPVEANTGASAPADAAPVTPPTPSTTTET